MFQHTRIAFLAAAVLAAAQLSGSALAAEPDDNVVVLTALPVTFSVATALTTGTHVTVQNVPEGGRRMNTQPGYFSLQAAKLAEQFASADAVITIGKLWQDDPLFVAARGANIRIVDIDATKPWSETLEGASVVLQPADDAPWSDTADQARTPSLYFWLSPSNGARVADIVAQDLMRLAPADAAQIQKNLSAYRRELLDLKREYEVKLAALADVTVYALGPDLVYLTTDMSIFVDGYFLKQDIHWTETDATSLTAYLKDHDVRVVIHQWEPDEKIQTAIKAGGAQLVVLDVGDAGIVEDGKLVADGYERLLRTNLEALYQGLLAASK